MKYGPFTAQICAEQADRYSKGKEEPERSLCYNAFFAGFMLNVAEVDVLEQKLAFANKEIARLSKGAPIEAVAKKVEAPKPIKAMDLF